MRRLLALGSRNIFTVSMVGRPNVGKSTMFNYLAGERLALTDAMGGLTRDRREQKIRLMGGEVLVVDTAGWHSSKRVDPSKVANHRKKKKRAGDTTYMLENKQLFRQMEQQMHRAVNQSDLVLFMLDAKTGVTQEDILLKNLLQKHFCLEAGQNESRENQTRPAKRVVCVVNKCENEFESIEYKQIYKLGLGEPVCVSTYHGDHMHDLYQRIQMELPQDHADSFDVVQEKRIRRHMEIRQRVKAEVEAEMEKRRESLREQGVKEETVEEQIGIDLQEWELDFDRANKAPEDNSELDSDSQCHYMTEQNQEILLDNLKSNVYEEHLYRLNQTVQLGVVGRANVGKSSLINSWLQDHRLIVDPLPGTTRDATSHSWAYKGRKITLVDTAGLEKAAHFKDAVDKKIQRETLNAIKYSQVVLLVIDGFSAFRTQDFSVANYVLSQGRALVLAVNKWDVVPEDKKDKIRRYLQQQIHRNLETKQVELVATSALSGKGRTHLLDSVLKTYQRWNQRISTGLLNDWLSAFKKVQSMPCSDGQVLKIRFIAQVKTRPPTFSLFVNQRQLIKTNYLQTLKMKLGEQFAMQGVPIRIQIRDEAHKKKDTKRAGEKKEGKRRAQLLRWSARRVEQLNRRVDP